MTLRGGRIAFWPHSNNRRIASVRMRCLAIIDGLRLLCLDAALYDPDQPAPRILVLSKRYDRDTLSRALELRASARTRLVIDLCDNHFYNPHELPDWTRRGDELKQCVDASDAVFTSSQPLADFVQQACPDAPRIHVIGDAIEAPDVRMRSWTNLDGWLDEARLLGLARRLPPNSVHLVWFGNHGSPYAEGGMSDLGRIAPHVGAAALGIGASLTVISNSRESYEQLRPALPLESFYLPWSKRTISRALKLHHIALIPITPNPFTICKSANRIATAFAHGLAVAADSIPSFRIFEGAAMFNDWPDALPLLATDPAERARRVACGQAIVNSHCSLPVIAREWQTALAMVDAGP